MVLREEEIKALEGWAEVVNKLFFNFKDGLKELEDGMVQAMLAPWADANAAATAEEVSSAVASDTAMRSRLKDLTAQRHGIAKLRKQFSKVGQVCNRSCMSRSFSWVPAILQVLTFCLICRN